MNSQNKKNNSFFANKTALTVACIIGFALLFVLVFFLTSLIFTSCNNNEAQNEPQTQEQTDIAVPVIPQTTAPAVEPEETSQPEETTAPVTTSISSDYTPGNVDYPDNTSAWQMICLNRNNFVGSDVEDKLSLSYVAGSGEMMDSRAAKAYEEMYKDAADDGYYLTPCSGYRSYSTQKRLYYEFYNDYLSQGYTEEEAHNLTSKRRNPPGSSEHNIGICMDIICAASSANFQNTAEYEWLCENAADYGFILRYPEDKVDITGVKYEPWHWRYVGVSNAHAIKASGLCLEEYLGLA